MRMDILSINCPHTPATFHLLSARRLKLIRAEAYIVNTARGEVIDENALARLLDTGEIAGAALDVFEHEPLDAASPLWDRHDVLITPHVSGFHAGYWPEATRLFSENLRRFIAGRPLENLVDKTAGY
jgi:phosphoglycerate dehydrogenase-like enzyme